MNQMNRDVEPAWHPRGEPSFPDWKIAPRGTRVRHVRTGRTGTFIRACGGGHSTYAVVDWDDVGFGVTRGRVVAAGFDLQEITDEGGETQ